MSKLRIGVIDTETTGLDYEKDEIIEIAMTIVEVCFTTGWARPIGTQVVETSEPDFYRVEGGAFDQLCDPGMHVPPSSTRIHHITDDDVEGMPPVDIVMRKFKEVVQEQRVDLLCAHNAAFDRQFVERHTGHMKPWICTYRLARKTYPDAEHYDNSYLRYWLHHGLPSGGPVHRALFDTYVTALTLCRILADGRHDKNIMKMHKHGDDAHTIAKALEERSESPIPVTRMPFGKYRGELLRDVPIDYLCWLEQNAKDRDLLLSVSAEISTRAWRAGK